MLVEVTREDIERGVPKDAFACAVALATMRAIGGTDDYLNGLADVFDGQVIIHVREKSTRCLLPMEVVEWIGRFDAGQPVEPFAFTLPDSVRELVTP